MKKYLYFGEELKEYGVRVLNEREVRAGAGILFFFAMIAFLNAWLVGNFYWTKVFVIAFLIDFSIRIFINPKYAPSLILGKFVVGNQKPEYVGAPQKRFAWGIGFLLALTMLFSIVIFNVVGPINMLICVTCLLLLFFESAFGICIGCKVYNWFNKEKAKLCPGGVCEVHQKEAIQKIGFPQLIIAIVFVGVVMAIPFSGLLSSTSEISGTCGVSAQKQITPCSGQSVPSSVIDEVAVEKDECEVPEWVVKIGNVERWKAHNCN